MRIKCDKCGFEGEPNEFEAVIEHEGERDECFTWVNESVSIKCKKCGHVSECLS